MHKHVHSEATYPLRVHQFTSQQVGKGGTNFHSSHKILSCVCKHVHSKATYHLRCKFTAQQVGKGGKEGTNFYSSNKILSCAWKHVHSKETYLLRVHQFTAHKWVKEVKRNKYSLITQNRTLSKQVCSFKGNLPPASAPVHSTAGG